MVPSLPSGRRWNGVKDEPASVVGMAATLRAAHGPDRLRGVHHATAAERDQRAIPRGRQQPPGQLGHRPGRNGQDLRGAVGEGFRRRGQSAVGREQCVALEAPFGQQPRGLRERPFAEANQALPV